VTLAASLVVPNLNGRELLRRHIPTLVAAAEAYGACEVIVVDDGSTDDSAEVVSRELPDVKLVRHQQNQGFAAACLSGVKAASSPVVILLNSDVSVERDFVRPLVLPFERDASVFAVSPLIENGAGEVAKVSLSRPYVRRGERRWKGVEPATLLALAKKPLDEPLELPSLFPLGGAVALDRARFLELGGFDPLYHPFYYEDVDLGLAAWRRGWKCLVEPRSRVRHEDGGTIGKHFKRWKIKVAKRRHRILMTWKHASPRWLRAHLAWLVVKCFTKILTLDMRFYVGLFQAMGRLGEARKARKREIEATKVTLEQAFETINAAPDP